MLRGLVGTVVALSAVLGPSVAQQNSEVPRTTSVAISGVTLIDGRGGPPLESATVVVREGRIASISRGSEYPSADVTIDGSGLFAIPGLIDGHVHVGTGTWTDEVERLERALRGGVTSVFDMAGDGRATSNLARAVKAGEIDGPTIYYTSLMAGPEFFTDPRVVRASLGYRPGDAPWNQAVTNETDLVRAVAAARGTGAVALKLYAAMEPTLLRRVAEEARHQGFRVIAHATVFPARPSEIIAAGVQMLAHTPYLVWEGSPPTPDFPSRARGDFLKVSPDSPAIESVLRSMRDRNVALNPTLWVFAERLPEDSVSHVRTPWMYAVTRRAAQLGVSIVAGTDGLFGSPRDQLPGLHRELELLVHEAGLTPMEAIAAATINTTRVIGVADSVGTLEEGKVADILLLERDPTLDISATRRIRFVLKGGQVICGLNASCASQRQ